MIAHEGANPDSTQVGPVRQTGKTVRVVEGVVQAAESGPGTVLIALEVTGDQLSLGVIEGPMGERLQDIMAQQGILSHHATDPLLGTVRLGTDVMVPPRSSC